MKSHIDRYRANAEQCLILAERASTPELRAQYTELSTHWAQLALDASYLDRLRETIAESEQATAKLRTGH